MAKRKTRPKKSLCIFSVGLHDTRITAAGADQFIVEGPFHVELNGDLDDPFIRSKKVAVYLHNVEATFDGQTLHVHAYVEPHGKAKDKLGVKALAEGLQEVGYRFVPVVWLDGTITKVVLQKGE